MGKYLPLRVQPYLMAFKQVRLFGKVPVACLPRFAGEFNLAERAVQLAVEFGSLLEGRLVSMDLTLNANVILRCERCLADFNWQLNHKQCLFIARKEEDIQDTAENADFIVCANEDMEIAELIEDELFLALPQVPKHESLKECDPAMKKYLLNNESERMEIPNPFSRLKKI